MPASATYHRRMRAAVRDRYGGPEVVRVEEVEEEAPVEDRVLVRVAAASVNRADLDGLYPRWQFTRAFLGLRRPRSRRLGIDVAGTVEAVGPDVTDFKLGDRVYGDLFNFGGGAFAQHVKPRQRALRRIPAGMTLEDAATLPHSAVLAVQGLRLRDGRTVREGDRVLIVGASGNVGPFAVQLAKHLGAEVTAVASTEKLDFVRSLGADHVIDYTRSDATRTGQQFDWILDVDAHQGLGRWVGSLKRGGVYLAQGGPGSWIVSALLSGAVLSKLTRRSLGLMLHWQPFDADDVALIERLYAEGALRPHIHRSFPLDEVRAALREVEVGRAKGKVVILP